MKRTMILLTVLAMVLCLVPCVRADAAAGEKIVYGLSGQGQELTAYRFGSGDNVLVMGFAIHGFEDNFDRDGLALVYAAEQLMTHLAGSDLPRLHGWTVYVLPCMNPDGTYYGNTNNGPGRCTTTYLDESGKLIQGRGIDMNRSFPVGFRAFSSSRNFNSTQPLACLESRALATFLQQVRGKGVNVLMDVHGWYQQIITTSDRLLKVTREQFPENNVTRENGGPGYLTSYAKSLGYESCLLELPEYIDSMAEFKSGSCVRRVLACVDGILKSEAPVCTTRGHSYEVISEIPATCLESGTAHCRCTVCGHTADLELPPRGHSYMELERLQEPTACRPGLAARICTVCNFQDTGPIPSIFTDAEPDRYYSDALDAAYEAGWISGISADTFGPGVTLSRAMLVTILYRMAGRPDADAGTPFVDLKEGAYYTQAVRWAYENGIVNGLTPTHFGPDAPVTRQQAVAIFHRYVQSLGLDNGLRTEIVFPDQADIDDYALEAAAWAAANGIILGDDKGNFLPEDSTTRAQAVTIVYRVAAYVEENGAE